MKKNEIFRFAIVIGGVLAIVSLFLPFMSAFSISKSLWDLLESSSYEAYIIIGFSIIAIVLPLINKKVELSYLSSGAIFAISIMYTISSIETEVFSYLGVGYYLLFLSGIIIAVSTYLFSYLKSEDKSIKVDSVNNNFNQIPLTPEISSVNLSNNSFGMPQVDSIQNQPSSSFNPTVQSQVQEAPSNSFGMPQVDSIQNQPSSSFNPTVQSQVQEAPSNSFGMPQVDSVNNQSSGINQSNDRASQTTFNNYFNN